MNLKNFEEKKSQNQRNTYCIYTELQEPAKLRQKIFE